MPWPLLHSMYSEWGGTRSSWIYLQASRSSSQPLFFLPCQCCWSGEADVCVHSCGYLFISSLPCPSWCVCVALHIHHYHRAGASYLLHLHHHAQVLHHSWLCHLVCQPPLTTAVGRCCTSLPRSSVGCLLWQVLQARHSKGGQAQDEWNFTSVHINCLAAISFPSSHTRILRHDSSIVLMFFKCNIQKTSLCS